MIKINGFKTARLIEGLTQQELAEKLGVSVVAVCKWESGQTFPRVRRLSEIASVLHTTVAELIEWRKEA